MNKQQTMIISATLGFLSVMLGAFGAHALKDTLNEFGRTETFELATKYQMYHALALFMTGLCFGTFENRYLKISSVSFIAGTILFSGSLYLLCFVELKAFALLTPIGGIFLLAGWAFLLISFLKREKPSQT